MSLDAGAGAGATSSGAGAAASGAPSASPSPGGATINVNPSGGSTQPPVPGTSNDWTSGLNDELKGYAQNKGWKDPSSVVDSYRNLEKVHGVPRERLLKLPEKAEDAEWGEVYNRLGRPSKADDYQLPVPEGDKGEFAKIAGGKFHELGLTKDQGQKLAKWWNDSLSQNKQTFEAQRTQALEGELNALKQEWGQAYDQNVNIARKAMTTFGISNEKIESLEKTTGFTDLMKLLHGIGSKIGEDQFISGDSKAGFGTMTPSAAESEIRTLRNDQSFVKDLLAKKADAVKRWDQLHQWAYGSAV
jgi:hypothetical protein